MSIGESNTYAHNSTSHLSPKVGGTVHIEVTGPENRTSASKNQNLQSNPKEFSPVGREMSSAAVSSPGSGGPTGVRQNLNELDVLLEDLSKAR